MNIVSRKKPDQFNPKLNNFKKYHHGFTEQKTMLDQINDSLELTWNYIGFID